MMKISVVVLLLLLIPAALAGRRGGKRLSRKRGKKGRGGGGKKNRIPSGPKIFSGSIKVVEPDFKPVSDAFDNLLGIKLKTTGTCDLLGDFTATFFFTPFQGLQQSFDGTCTIEDASGNTLNAAFFGASIQPPEEGETESLVPLNAHIIGGGGIYEGYSGKLDLSGSIKYKENGFGETNFLMRGSMMKLPKKVKKKHLKILGIPQSIPFDGQAEFPDASKMLTKMTKSELEAEPDAAIEAESETEPYAGDIKPVEENPESEEEATSHFKGGGIWKSAKAWTDEAVAST